ncbi:hypothetical protein [Enterococcus sp. LJL90]
MMILITLFLLILAGLFALIGFKFRNKKWLRLIAGNNFKEHTKEAADIAPFVGIVMFVLCAFILATAFFTTYLYLK